MKAIVIGSGFGGLAVAIRLARRGYDVTVLERLDQPGGRARVFKQDGFTFDAGPTVITAPFLFEELWSLCGLCMKDEIDLRPVDPFYRIRFDDGEVFNYTGDPNAMHTEIARINPDDVTGYEAFFKQSEAIFRVGFQELADVPFDSIQSMLRIVPKMARLKSYRTVYNLVSSYIKHPKLRQVFSFHPLLVGGNPFSTTSIYALIAFLERKWGVHFPMGGTGVLVQGMVRLLERCGGELKLRTNVEEILVEQNRVKGVRISGGQELNADIIVSNADSAWTYRYLIPHKFRKTWTDPKLDRARYSMGLFVWYFGTSCVYPDVKHHTILLGPRYRELLRDIFDRRILAKDFSLYLHRPTATDSRLAPSGKDAFYVLSPVPHLQSGINWNETAEYYRQAIASYLSSSILPNLEANVVTSKVMTPQHFQDELLAFRGAAFSFEPIFSQSAYFRPHNQSKDIKGLYFVGAGTHPGAGVPGVLSSARVIDRLLSTKPCGAQG